MLHHTDLGAHIASLAFPHRKDIPNIVAQHVQEDLGRECKFDDWVKLVDFLGKNAV